MMILIKTLIQDCWARGPINHDEINHPRHHGAMQRHQLGKLISLLNVGHGNRSGNQWTQKTPEAITNEINHTIPTNANVIA